MITAFISCAKTMTAKGSFDLSATTVPQFSANAEANAMALSHLTAGELKEMLKVNDKIAAENCLRYHNFLSADQGLLPALLAYTGVVFKHINPSDFTSEDWDYAQEHLLITSFLYGLLRPLDLIRNYRLEGDVRLEENGGRTMFDYWKPLLTDYFIDTVRKNGGTLVNLASGEMKMLFDWKKVQESVRVVTPEFCVMKDGKLKTVTVYAKMCRGEMTRFIIKNKVQTASQLSGFEWEGFRFDERQSTGDNLIFVLD